MRTDSDQYSVQLIANAEHRVEIATAKLAAAEDYRFYVGIALGLLAWKVFALNGWISFAIASVAFFLADYTYSKEYDSAEDALERLTGTGKYFTARQPEADVGGASIH